VFAAEFQVVRRAVPDVIKMLRRGKPMNRDLHLATILLPYIFFGSINAIAAQPITTAPGDPSFAWVWSTQSRPPDPPREPQPLSSFKVEFTALGSQTFGPTETKEIVRFRNVLHPPGEPERVLSETGKPTRPYVEIGELKFGLNWYYSSNIQELINTHVPRVGGDAVLVYHAHSGGATARDTKMGRQAFYQSIVLEVIRYTDR